MQVWLRLLIIWFIAFALPAHGVAGVTMAHCGSSHERMGGALLAEHPGHVGHEAGASHDHAAGLAHLAAQGAQQDAHQDVHHHAHHQALEDADLAEAQSGTMSDLGQFKCSSCASCCAAAALLGGPGGLPELMAAPDIFVHPTVTVDAVVFDGPDRPPRTHLV